MRAERERDMAAVRNRSSNPAKLRLPAVRSKMKCDPEGYESELLLVYSQFNSSVALFEQQAAMSFTSLSGVASDPSVAKDLADRATFLAHLTPFYPTHLSQFPKQLLHLLTSSAHSLPSSLRYHLAQALILLTNRQIVDFGETLPLFMELQILGDKSLKIRAFKHVIGSIKLMNKKHKNVPKNRKLQNFLFSMSQQADEAKAKRALVTLFDLYRRKVWFDDRTADAICTACFHPSSKIMKAALKFILHYENASDDGDRDGSSSEDDFIPLKEHVLLSKEAIYKAHHMGTHASRKKRKAKLQRDIRSSRRHQRLSSGGRISNYYSPLNDLKDAQGFVEKLFSRLQTRNEPFKVKIEMFRTISRAIALHRLVLLNFYPFLQKYVKPHGQDDVIKILAAAADACHDMVPPDVVEPLFRQIVNQFVHDKSPPEVICVGLSAIREISCRMPLLMTEDLLQDLTQYKKNREKSVSIAARSLIALFREKWPDLLSKKDRGHLTNPGARPNLFGEATVANDVPGAELLQSDGDEIDYSDEGSGNDCDSGESISGESDCGESDIDCNDESQGNDDGETEDHEVTEGVEGCNISYNEDDDVTDGQYEDDEDEVEAENEENDDAYEVNNRIGEVCSHVMKRKFSNSDATQSLCSQKRTFGEVDNAYYTKQSRCPSLCLSSQVSAKIEERLSKICRSENFHEARPKRVDPAVLEINLPRKLSMEERLKPAKEQREDRGKYVARTALKKNKTGGLSNRQKEHGKAMPLAAKRSKVAKSRLVKKKKQLRSGKQFRGRKAWK